MGGITALRRIQLGDEGTPGTAVAASAIWRGTGLLNDEREIKHVPEQVGIAIPTTRNYVPKLAASIRMDSKEATFEQLPYILEAGIATETPTQDGAGSDYIYAYATPTSSANTLRYYTIEGGNNEHVMEAEYCFVESFKLSGNAGEGVMMEAAWMGRQALDSSFTGAISIPTVEEIIFGGGAFYIDDSGGTIGSTAVANTLLNFELDVTTGWKPKFTQAQKYYDFPYFDGTSFQATLRLRYEHNATIDTERDDYETGAVRLVQIQFTGSSVATPGTTYSAKQLIINAAGFYTEYPLGSQDGNDVIEAVMTVGYSPDDTQGLDFIVVNELSALP